MAWKKGQAGWREWNSQANRYAELNRLVALNVVFSNYSKSVNAINVFRSIGKRGSAKLKANDDDAINAETELYLELWQLSG